MNFKNNFSRKIYLIAFQFRKCQLYWKYLKAVLKIFILWLEKAL